MTKSREPALFPVPDPSPGPLREALEADLAKLRDRDLLQGRDAVVALARHLADNLDQAPNPSMTGQFLTCLRGLGIGTVEAAGGPDAYDKLLEELQS